MSGTAKVQLLLELRNRLRSGMGQAREYLSRNVNAMKAKLGELKQKYGAAFDEMESRIPGFGNALSLLANPYALITAAVIGLAVAYGKAMALSNEWQNSMAKVNVTAQLSKKDLKGVSDQLLEIGRRNTTDLMEVPEAFNKIISAGLDTKTALATLEPTLKAAKAGFTDVETVAGAAVSTMNSSGVMDANRVYDILFATLNKGNAEFKDVADYLPKIIPGARQAGFDLEQTAGAFAYLTAQGLKAEAASTSLSNAFKALSTPDIIYGSKSKGGFKSLGVDVFDASGKMRDLISISTDMNKVMAGLTDEQRIKKFAAIGLDMEAATAFNIMSQNVDKLKDSIDFTTNSQGQLNEAVKNSAQPMDAWKVLGNEVKAIMIGIGEDGVGWFGQIGQSILDTWNSIKKLYDESTLFRDIVSVIGFVFENAFNMATFAIRLTWNILSSVWDKITEVKTAIFGAGDGFENWYLRIKPYILWVWQYLNGIQNVLLSIGSMDMDGLKKSIEGLSNAKNIQELRQQVIIEDQQHKAELAAKNNPAPLADQGGVKQTGTGKPTGNTGKGSGGSGSKVTGMQGQPKNITFNMDAMIKMGDVVTKNDNGQPMSKRELEQFFQEMILRTLHNIETSYS
jgi:TP901 family phage tail tape measure protein